MSLYGNVKKIGSSSFLFDRVYNNRQEMDEAATTDGVYAGRYVLVEYGERYNENSEERQEYTANKTIDLEAYGAVYDSTVWQKIYIKKESTNSNDPSDKYIMVAELNATVPKIEFILEEPITYIVVNNESQDAPLDGLIVGSIVNNLLTEMLPLKNAKELFNLPYFDTAIDTELSYTLHLPTMLNLKVNNEDINFNKNGFNPVYSFGIEKGVLAAAAWVPEEINSTKYDVDSTDGKAVLNQNSIDVNTKVLFMSFPALGNAMNSLYDLLYGKPVEVDGINGTIRPYFLQFADTYLTITVPLVVNGEIVTVGGKEVMVTGQPGKPVALPISTLLTGEVYPSSVGLGEDQILYYKDENNELLDLLVSFTMPEANGLNDDLKWLDRVPGLAEILANNTMGLASVLKYLFGVSNPITGITRYYLQSDWTISNEDGSNVPFISKKPLVVGGYNITFTPKIETFSNLAEDAINGATIINSYTEETVSNEFSGGHYKIDYDTWRLVDIRE